MWRPIEEIDQVYDGFFLLFSKEFIDPDFNPQGVVEGYWQDGEGWVAAVWCGYHDEWHAKTVVPTHFHNVPSTEHLL